MSDGIGYWSNIAAKQNDARWDVEINDERDAQDGVECLMKRCNAPSFHGYQIGEAWFDFCRDHNDPENAFELYDRSNEGED